MIFYSSRHISRGGMYFPCFCILEMKHMTLLQRDKEISNYPASKAGFLISYGQQGSIQRHTAENPFWLSTYRRRFDGACHSAPDSSRFWRETENVRKGCWPGWTDTGRRAADFYPVRRDSCKWQIYKQGLHGSNKEAHQHDTVRTALWEGKNWIC